MPDSLNRAAASVRRLVTNRLLEEPLPTEAPWRRLTEALTVCKHLQPGQHEAAIVCHRTIVRVLRADLACLGVAEEAHLAIVHELMDFLHCSGFERHAGTWRSTPTMELASGPQLVEAG
jgi:broad specificity phosphatase PhoE